jgi:hypothetical protein
LCSLNLSPNLVPRVSPHPLLAFRLFTESKAPFFAPIKPKCTPMLHTVVILLSDYHKIMNMPKKFSPFDQSALDMAGSKFI